MFSLQNFWNYEDKMACYNFPCCSCWVYYFRRSVNQNISKSKKWVNHCIGWTFENTQDCSHVYYYVDGQHIDFNAPNAYSWLISDRQKVTPSFAAVCGSFSTALSIQNADKHVLKRVGLVGKLEDRDWRTGQLCTCRVNWKTRYFAGGSYLHIPFVSGCTYLNRRWKPDNAVHIVTVVTQYVFTVISWQVLLWKCHLVKKEREGRWA